MGQVTIAIKAVTQLSNAKVLVTTPQKIRLIIVDQEH